MKILRDEKLVCGGAILSLDNILTAAHCVRDPNGVYNVVSGSHFRNDGVRHGIITKILHEDYKVGLNGNDLATLIITPPIDARHSSNRKIKLFKETLPPIASSIFSGWGCNRIFM